MGSNLRLMTVARAAAVAALVVLQGPAEAPAADQDHNALIGAELAVGQRIGCKDPDYDTMVADPGWTDRFRNDSARGTVWFRIDPAAAQAPDEPFLAEATVMVSYAEWTSGAGFVTQEQEQALSVAWTPTPTGDTHLPDLQVLPIDGAFLLDVEVTRLWSTLGTIPTNLMLEARCDTERTWFLDPDGAAISTGATGGEAAEDLQLYWEDVPGASAYELEWVFVPAWRARADGEGYYASASKISWSNDLFERGATRVSTASRRYSMPALYERGYLLWRVRAVGVDAEGATTRTGWSPAAPAEGSPLATYGALRSLSGHERSRSWDATAVFASDGRRQDAVRYLDGLARPRQEQTRLGGVLQVGETFYDPDGRAAVEAMPAPAGTDHFGYISRFTVGTSGAAYALTGHDVAPAMGTQSGASRYYSAKNPDREGAQAYVPDAEGYPFTQTVYAPEPGARVVRQGAPGPAFQIGGGHDQLADEGQPDQAELDALFGSEAGYASIHRKTIQLDRNGQAHVAYFDAEGRIVAASLAGDPPSNLEELPGVEAFVSTTDLLDSAVLSTDPASADVHRSLVVSTAAPQILAWSVQPVAYEPECPTGAAPEAVPCAWDLAISLRDAEGDDQFEPVSMQVGEEGASWSETTEALPVGSYSLTKTLTLDMDAAEAAADAWLAGDCAPQLADFEAEEVDGLDLDSCDLDCAECKERLGKDTDASTDGDEGPERATLAEICESVCEGTSSCDTARAAMLADLSPGGQYATTTDGDGAWAPDDLSIFNPDSELPGRPYAPDLLGLDGTAEEVAASWTGEDAEAVLTVHPEHDVYAWRCLDPARAEVVAFGDALLDLETLTDARTAQRVRRDDLVGADPLGSELGGALDELQPWATACAIALCDPDEVSCAACADPEDAMMSMSGGREREAWAALRARYLQARESVLAEQMEAAGLSTTWPYEDKVSRFPTPESLHELAESIDTDAALEAACDQCPGAQSLQRLLDAVAGDQRLDDSFTTSDYAEAAGELEGWPDEGRWRGTSKGGSAQTLSVEVTDTATGGSCSLSLAMPPRAPYGWDDVSAVLQVQSSDALKLVTSEAGYGFTLLAEMSDGERVELEGTSTCFIVDDCAEDRCDCADDDGDGRVDEGCSHTITLEAAGDDTFDAWLDGEPWGSGEGYKDLQDLSADVEPGGHAIAVHTRDVGRVVSGFIGLVRVDGVAAAATGAGRWHAQSTSPTSATWTTDAIGAMPADSAALATSCEILWSDAETPAGARWVHSGSCSCGGATCADNWLRVDVNTCGSSASSSAPAGVGVTATSATFEAADDTDLADDTDSDTGGAAPVDCDVALLENPDLERGAAQKPDSDLDYTSACPTEGKYTITGDSASTGSTGPRPAASASSFRAESWWAALIRRIQEIIRARPALTCDPGYADHTVPLGKGHYLLAAGTSAAAAGEEPNSPSPQVLWSEQVSVTAGVSYTFGAWVMAVDSTTDEDAPTLLLTIDGAPLTGRLLPTTAGFWRPLRAGWTAGDDGVVTLAVVRELPSTADGEVPATVRVGIDDVTFAPAECSTDAICAVEPFPSVDLDDPVAVCEDQLHAGAEARAEARYEAALAEQRAAFLLGYERQCMGAPETFTLSREEKEHQYTLYHYDRAGELVATTPPLAVRPERDPAWLAGAASARDAGNVSPKLAPNLTGLMSWYAYDSLGGLVWRSSPDEGTIHYRYDHAGRLRASQSARQAPGAWSYVSYDERGRVVEVGELDLGRAPTTDELEDGSWPEAGARTDRTRFVYDDLSWLEEQGQGALAAELFPDEACEQRGRVVGALSLRASEDEGLVPWTAATWYCYDPSGYVRGIVQDLPELSAVGHRLSRISYSYSLPDGLVDEVRVELGDDEALLHRYRYDQDGRMTEALSSSDGIVWDTDASWRYYQHGPLARATLGDAAVQGLDYTYTLLGWLKGINSDTLRARRDPGADDADAFGETLDYYKGDYKPIGSAARAFEASRSAPYRQGLIRGLYDGNVAASSLAVRPLMEADPSSPLTRDPHLSTYAYDQLGRLRVARTYVSPVVVGSNTWPGRVPQVQRAFSAEHHYDPNGNFVALGGPGSSAIERQALGKPMDALRYVYPQDADGEPAGNSLLHVYDTVPSSTLDDDLDDQGAGCDPNTGSGCNFQYDASGNLVADAQRDISKVTWTAYGRPSRVELASGSVGATQAYDAFANRVALRVRSTPTPLRSQQERWIADWSIRGADGEVLARLDLDLEQTCEEGRSTTVTVPTVADAGASPAVSVVTLAGRSILGMSVRWQGNPEATAIALAAAINTESGDSDYLAEDLGEGELKIWPAAGSNALASGLRVQVEGAAEEVGAAAGGTGGAGGLSLRDRTPDGASRVCDDGALVVRPSHVLLGLGRIGTRVGERRAFTARQGLFDEAGALAATSLEAAESAAAGALITRLTGERRYELADHLGDVVAVVSGDVQTSQASGGAVARSPTVVMATEYAPFGQPMPGRSTGRASYTWGFNGQETDHGMDEDVAYGTRTYRADLGRFTSVDSMAAAFPWYSPYQFAGDSPEHFVDLEGHEPVLPIVVGISYVAVRTAIDPNAAPAIVFEVTGGMTRYRAQLDGGWSRFGSWVHAMQLGSSGIGDIMKLHAAQQKGASIDRQTSLTDRWGTPQIFVANSNINNSNFANLLLGGYFDGSIPETMVFPAGHPISKQLMKSAFVQNHVREFRKSSRTQDRVPYNDPGLSLVDFAIGDHVSAFIGSYNMFIWKDFKAQKIYVSIFNVTSRGSGDLWGNVIKTFPRPLAKGVQRIQELDYAQPLSNFGQFFFGQFDLVDEKSSGGGTAESKGSDAPCADF